MPGFLGNAWNAVKKGVTDVGHVAGKVASNPLVEGLAGATLGPEAAAALGGIGHLIAPGGNIGSGLKGAVTGGAAGLAGSGIKNLGGMALSGLGGAGGSTPAWGAGSGGIDLGGLLKSGVSGLAGLAGGGGGGLSLGGLANAGLGAAGIANAASLQNKSNQYATNAMDTANQSYDSRAPLRTAGVQGMLSPSSGIDLSGLKKIAGRNSFS